MRVQLRCGYPTKDHLSRDPAASLGSDYAHTPACLSQGPHHQNYCKLSRCTPSSADGVGHCKSWQMRICSWANEHGFYFI
jgi:hypothetical protein